LTIGSESSMGVGVGTERFMGNVDGMGLTVTPLYGFSPMISKCISFRNRKWHNTSAANDVQNSSTMEITLGQERSLGYYCLSGTLSVIRLCWRDRQEFCPRQEM